MKLHLRKGGVVEGPVYMSTMGRDIASFELDFADLEVLVKEDPARVRDFLSVLMTRFGYVPKESKMELTFGQKAVGLTFNPSGDNAVHDCKAEFARVIDRMHNLRNNTTDPEVKRMASVAITEAQTAQMWAVKAITWQG